MAEVSLVATFMDERLPAPRRLAAMREFEAQARARRGEQPDLVTLGDDDKRELATLMRRRTDNLEVRMGAGDVLAGMDRRYALEVCLELLRRSAPPPLNAG